MVTVSDGNAVSFVITVSRRVSVLGQIFVASILVTDRPKDEITSSILSLRTLKKVAV
jgi:hypothetical protein